MALKTWNPRSVSQFIPVNISREEWKQGDKRALLKRDIIARYEPNYRRYPFLKNRIKKNFDDFWRFYTAIYGDGFEQQRWIIRIFDSILQGLMDRKKDMQELDIEREKNQLWFQSEELVGGVLYVDLFSGDLKGLREKIPYLKEMGINFLHLMPLLRPRDGLNDGGYAVQNYRDIDRRLGTYDQLRKISRILHQEGINLVLDFVMNHTAKEHGWAQAAMSGHPRYQKFYHMFDDRTMPDMYERHLIEVFPDFAPGNFSYYPQMDKWVWTTFYEFQWDLNYANPDVFHAMFDEMVHLINTGADCLRLDAVPYLWKKLGTHCQNQNEAHHLLQAYRALLRIISPGVLFKAEAIVGPEEIIRYLGSDGFEGKECDLAYNATLMCHLWHALAAENTHLLRTSLHSLPRAPQNTSWVNYVRCHDDIGWGISDEFAGAVNQNGHHTRMFCTDFYTGKISGSYAEGYAFQRDYYSGEARVSGTLASLSGLQKTMVETDDEGMNDAIKRIMLINNVIFSWKGIPLMYMGDEIGQTNYYGYLSNPLKMRDNRWVHRPPMDWDKAELRNSPGTIEHRLFSEFLKLIEARKMNPVLHGASKDRLFLIEHDAVFCFERSYKGQKALFLSNFSRKPIHISTQSLPDEWRKRFFFDLYSHRVFDFSFNEIVLEPYEFYWLTDTETRPSKEAENTIIDVHAETIPGENIYLVGNIPELGSWDPSKAIGPMDPSSYPTWEIQLRLPANTFFEYQWVKKKNGQILEWSPDKYWMKSGDEISY
ncbi:alpha-amylase family glycosyl hydrolase [Balneolaceae bacterium ANBcel3]|nr:alpha-amylase family glycosyl hydrolase [Balneolaceae bacterium ANBcel3]